MDGWVSGRGEGGFYQCRCQMATAGCCCAPPAADPEDLPTQGTTPPNLAPHSITYPPPHNHLNPRTRGVVDVGDGLLQLLPQVAQKRRHLLRTLVQPVALAAREGKGGQEAGREGQGLGQTEQPQDSTARIQL